MNHTLSISITKLTLRKGKYNFFVLKSSWVVNLGNFNVQIINTENDNVQYVKETVKTYHLINLEKATKYGEFEIKEGGKYQIKINNQEDLEVKNSESFSFTQINIFGLRNSFLQSRQSNLKFMIKTKN